MTQKSLKKQKYGKYIRYCQLVALSIMIPYVALGMIGYVAWYAGTSDDGGHLFPLNLVFAYGPNDPECFEVGDCDLFAAPFDAMIAPFDAVFEGFTLVIVWGIIIGILWLRVSNPLMVGVVGVALAALFTRPDPACIALGGEKLDCLTGFSNEAQAVGWGLLILAIVVAIYQILTVRVNFPTN